MPYPFQIVQGQKDILFVYEYASSNRIVHMSNHDEAPVDSWMGWSNGKWDGDTLVIEVTGNNDQTWFDRAGNHHSDQLKVTERYHARGRQRHINYEATIEDPRTFSRPWTIRMPLYRRHRPERAAARVQVRGVLRRAALRRSEEENGVVAIASWQQSGVIFRSVVQAARPPSAEVSSGGPTSRRETQVSRRAYQS